MLSRIKWIRLQNVLYYVDSITIRTIIQGTSKRLFPGLVNFVLAVAYHFCLNVLAGYSQPGNSLIVKPCIHSLRRGGLKAMQGIKSQFSIEGQTERESGIAESLAR